MDIWPWLCLSLIVGFLAEFVSGKGLLLPPIYWNSTNEMFKSNNNDHIIRVNLGETIDIICPSYFPGYDRNKMEYYTIYQVSKRDYEDCKIPTDIYKRPLINCSHPQYRRRYTIIVSRFSGIPNSPEFQRGQSYYFITTSTGESDGLANTYQGSCKTHNMKMIFKVCCKTDSQGGNGRVTRPKRPRVTTTSTQSTTTRRQQTTTKQYIPSKNKNKDKDKITNEVLPNNPSDMKRVSQGSASISYSIITTVTCALLVTFMTRRRHVTNR